MLLPIAIVETFVIRKIGVSVVHCGVRGRKDWGTEKHRNYAVREGLRRTKRSQEGSQPGLWGR